MTAVEHNREGRTDFDVRWRWADERLTPGFTAVMRVRDEARNLPWVLPALLRSVERVVLVDNGSIDGTPDVARDLARRHDATDRLDVHAYPFAVARCGSEHLHTAADSVHSLTYFYNWSFSHVVTTYALKWDGDMVLTREGEQIVADLAWQLEATATVLPIPRVPVYVASPDRAYVDVGLAHHEPCGWPNTPAHRFAKGFEWEVPVRSNDTALRVFPSLICFEIKWLDADEFLDSDRTVRKQRDWAIHRDLNRGIVPRDLVPISSDGAAHVLDVVRDTGRARWQALIDAGGHDRAAEAPREDTGRRVTRWWSSRRRP